VASVTSALPTPWRYQGRILESAAGTPDLYDFGARSYNPALGAFTSLDTLNGSAQNPALLNGYPRSLVRDSDRRPRALAVGRRASTGFDSGDGAGRGVGDGLLDTGCLSGHVGHPTASHQDHGDPARLEVLLRW